ncbi:MAG: HDOD domain-containing protein [Gammaproteobacteria bacterium]|nr:HDOD domain-containing protein [Gammaproteobacteria bacterium]
MSTHKVFRTVLDYLAITTQIGVSLTADDNYAEAVLLKDDQGFVVAIFPASHKLELAALNAILQRQELRVLNREDLDALHRYFQQQPPNPASKGFKFIFAEALAEYKNIMIILDEQTQPLQLPPLNFSALSNRSLFGSHISSPDPDEQTGDTPKLDIREQLKNIQNLPVMPDMALRIMELKNNPDANIDQLVEVVSMDVSISAQVMRYANSALFGQHGKVKTLNDAIFRVLGYENVLHMVLGSAMAKAFKLPANGPLGADTFWQNATYSASLMQKLSRELDKSLDVKPGLAYLCGLLHNIGYLVLGSLFPSEYFWFNKVLSAKKDTPVIEIEQRLLGITHIELGEQLMQFWHMPEEIISVIAHHHQIDYEGEHDSYVHLLMLVDQILKGHNMSDADTDEISEDLCSQLGLSDEQVYEAMDEMLQCGEELDVIIKSMSA